jgi:hypothetical protein
MLATSFDSLMLSSYPSYLYDAIKSPIGSCSGYSVDLLSTTEAWFAETFEEYMTS